MWFTPEALAPEPLGAMTPDPIDPDIISSHFAAPSRSSFHSVRRSVSVLHKSWFLKPVINRRDWRVLSMRLCSVEERVGRQLAVIGDEVDAQYASVFRKMIDSLSFDETTPYDNFAIVARQLVLQSFRSVSLCPSCIREWVTVSLWLITLLVNDFSEFFRQKVTFRYAGTAFRDVKSLCIRPIANISHTSKLRLLISY